MEQLTRDELQRLTTPERLTLISQLWDSLEEQHLPLTGPQQAELDRRLASIEQERNAGITWSMLKAELERRSPLCIAASGAHSSDGPPTLSSW